MTATVPTVEGDSPSVAQVTTLVETLRARQPEWEAIGIDERAAWLRRYADWLLDNEQRLTDLLSAEVGKPGIEATMELMFSVELIKYYAANASKFLGETGTPVHSLLNLPKRVRVARRPYAVVGVITPWNFPLGLSLVDSVPALLAGAAVAVKPAPQTPNIVLAAVGGWAEIGAPAVFDACVGDADVGSALVDRVDFVQFTGSTATGRRIALRCAERLIPCGLELGGKDPALVLADANLEAAACGIAWGALSNAGQMCTSVERVYVEAAVYDEFVDHLVAHVSTLRRDIDIAPLTTSAQFDLVRAQLADAVADGARVAFGGTTDPVARWVEPTVLVNVDHTMECLREETFGPVIPVMRVPDEAAAIRMANDSPFGLSASVWTRSVRRAQRVAAQLDAGAVNVNDASAHLFCFPAPMAGWKESGAGGRFGGAAGVLKYTRSQTVTLPRVRYSYQRHVLWYPYTAFRDRLVRRMLRAVAATGRRRFFTTSG